VGSALALFFGKVTIVLLVLCGIALLVLARVRRRLRVSPRVATDAPLRWLASPQLAARLHRRLQGAVRAVRAATKAPSRRSTRPQAPASAATRLAADLEREAVLIDRRIVAVAKLGPAERRRALEHSAREVARLEGLAHRIADLAREEQQRPVLAGGESALDDLAARVERLETARAELTVIETEARLAAPAQLPARHTA
jgi:hypothetical protein